MTPARSINIFIPFLCFGIGAQCVRAHAGIFDHIVPDMGNGGHSIEKSIQDVGKALDKAGQDVGGTVSKPFPEIEHSPTDPCTNNGKLPQCDVDKSERHQ